MKIIDLNSPAVQAGLSQLFALMKSILSEKHFRLLVGAFAIWLGRGWLTFLSDVSKTSRQRISRGKREIETNDPIIYSSRTRREGGGRKRKEEGVPGIERQIEDLIQRSSYGSPDDGKIICNAPAVARTAGIPYTLQLSENNLGLDSRN